MTLTKYSDKAKKTLAFLFRPFNDIDIYIEDTTCQNMYLIYFERVLNGKAKIARVFPLGSRSNVIDECRKDQFDTKRSRLYIIDGDFEFCLGKGAPRLKHIHRIRAYCFENLLLSPNALVEVAFESTTDQNRESLNKKLSCDDFVARVSAKLWPLYLIYLTVQKLDPSIETIGFHVYKLATDNLTDLYLDERKINDRISDIEAQMTRKFGAKDVKSTMNDVTKMLNKVEQSRYISGKDYLMPLVHRHLKMQAKLPGNQNQLKCKLARHCELDADPELNHKINNLTGT
jgi:hypothetical protein